MDARELNQEQLDELKWKVYYLNEDDMFYDMLMESWNDDIQIEHEKAQYPSDISNETIYKLFDGIDFVDDDFCCSCEEEAFFDANYTVFVYYDEFGDNLACCFEYDNEDEAISKADSFVGKYDRVEVVDKFGEKIY